MFKEKVLSCLQSLVVFGKSLPGWFRADFMWLLLFVPVLYVILMFFLSANNIFGWQDTHVCKNVLEIIHPALLGSAVFLAFVGWFWLRDFSLASIGLLCCGALGREILGQGYTFVFVIAILVVVVLVEQNRERMVSFLQSRLATSLLSMTFICYLVSQLLDRGLIKRIGWLLMWDTSWDVPYSSNIEESLETLGGLFLVLTILSLILLGYRRLKQQ